MSIERKIKQAQERRLKRVKRKILINAVFQGKIRVTIQRSLQQFYAQAIDDTKRITVASCSTLVTKNPEKKSKVLLAFDLGKDFAKSLFNNLNKSAKKLSLLFFATVLNLLFP